MTAPRFPNQCCGWVKSKKWDDVRPCHCIGTVLVNGRLYCLTCAKAAKEPK